MIYLDNAATTSPKPMSVRSAAAEAMRLSANPGRSGHDLSLRASEEIYRARKAAAAFFHAEQAASERARRKAGRTVSPRRILAETLLMRSGCKTAMCWRFAQRSTAKRLLAFCRLI